MTAPHTRIPPHRIAILGAGRSRFGALPSAMVSIDEHRRVLDWLLASFAVLHSPQIHFVAGYKANEVETEYPDISFSFNPDWETTGPARSLALISLASQASTFVRYSDVLFRPHTVHAMEEAGGDLVLAIDSRWRVRYDGRSRTELDSAEKLLFDGGNLIDVGKTVPTDRATAEFAGLLKLSPNMATRLQNSLRSGVFRRHSIFHTLRAYRRYIPYRSQNRNRALYSEPLR